MSGNDLSRREFLQKLALGASVLVLGASIRTTADSSEDDVALAFIGVGGRGTHLLRKMVNVPGAWVIAVCDLIEYRARRAQEIAQESKPRAYVDFRRMLEKEKLDGVVVATEVGNHAKVVIPVDRKDPPIPTSEDKSAIIYTLAGGIVYSYTHLSYLPQHFQNEKLWVFGEKAGVDLPEGMMYGRDGKEERIGEASGPDWDKGTDEELAGFVEAVRKNDKNLVRSNQETGRIATLMSILGRKAMYNRATDKFEPRLLKWEDLGSTT